MADVLTNAHYDMLLRAERSLSDAIPLIQKAKDVGVDTSEFEEGHAFMADRLARYRRTFFPDQVTGSNPSGVPMYGN